MVNLVCKHPIVDESNTTEGFCKVKLLLAIRIDAILVGFQHYDSSFHALAFDVLLDYVYGCSTRCEQTIGT